jgi:hypothetical protein
MWQASGMAPLNKYCYQNHSGSKKLNGSEEEKKNSFSISRGFFLFFEKVSISRGESDFSRCFARRRGGPFFSLSTSLMGSTVNALTGPPFTAHTAVSLSARPE